MRFNKNQAARAIGRHLFDFIPIDMDQSLIKQKVTFHYMNGVNESLVSELTKLNETEGVPTGASSKSESSSSVYVFPVTALHVYLLTLLKGKRAYILDRSGRLCRPRFKPISHFWQLFYYHVLQYLFLPFIRMGIPVRDEFSRMQRHIRRVKEIYNEGRAESLRWNRLLWRLIKKGMLFSYYRVVILWRIVRELMTMMSYVFLIFPVVIISLGFVYGYFLVTQRLRSRILSAYVF